MESIELGWLNELMHTSLRKFCDTKEADHLWHLLHAVECEPRKQFYKIIAKALEKGESERHWENVKQALLNKDLEMYNAMGIGDQMKALQTACGLLSDDDWEGFCGNIYLLEMQSKPS